MTSFPTARLLSREDVTLIVLDMQARLLPVVTGADSVLRACRRMVRACDVLGVPVLFTEQYPQGLGPTVPELADLFGDRRPIAKTAFGCFGCAEFAEAVERTGRRSLLLSGIETHICVCQTALQALVRGFDVFLLEDCTGARGEEARRIGLDRLHAAGVVPSHSEMAMYELMGEADSAEFRTILSIIKGEGRGEQIRQNGPDLA